MFRMNLCEVQENPKIPGAGAQRPGSFLLEECLPPLVTPQ